MGIDKLGLNDLKLSPECTVVGCFKNVNTYILFWVFFNQLKYFNI